MELAEIVSYIATGLLLISYCCRTVWLRVFQIFGGVANIIFAAMILEQSISARSIIYSNIIYLTINIIQFFRELKRKRYEIHNQRWLEAQPK